MYSVIVCVRVRIPWATLVKFKSSKIEKRGTSASRGSAYYGDSSSRDVCNILEIFTLSQTLHNKQFPADFGENGLKSPCA